MATFNWQPTYPATLSYKPQFQSIAYGDGYEQNVPVGINNNPEHWALSFNNLDSVTAYAINDFLLANDGQRFDWTNERGVAIKVKCKEWSMDVALDGKYTMKFTFDEAFGS